MFWLIITLVAGALCVTYLVIGASPALLRMSGERRRTCHTAGVTLILLTLVFLAKYLTHASV
jgi:hypothetical protein